MVEIASVTSFPALHFLSNFDVVGVRVGLGLGDVVDVRADILAHKFDKIECCRQSWMYETDPEFLTYCNNTSRF
jgi:hypothetical protein